MITNDAQFQNDPSLFHRSSPESDEATDVSISQPATREEYDFAKHKCTVFRRLEAENIPKSAIALFIIMLVGTIVAAKVLGGEEAVQKIIEEKNLENIVYSLEASLGYLVCIAIYKGISHRFVNKIRNNMVRDLNDSGKQNEFEEFIKEQKTLGILNNDIPFDELKKDVELYVLWKTKEKSLDDVKSLNTKWVALRDRIKERLFTNYKPETTPPDITQSTILSNQTSSTANAVIITASLNGLKPEVLNQVPINIYKSQASPEPKSEERREYTQLLAMYQDKVGPLPPYDENDKTMGSELENFVDETIRINKKIDDEDTMNNVKAKLLKDKNIYLLCRIQILRNSRQLELSKNQELQFNKLAYSTYISVLKDESRKFLGL